MVQQSDPVSPAAARKSGAVQSYRGWKLEDAKARFSEIVRRARSEGPQRVTVRGKDAVVVISAEELELLLPREARLPFVTFMESLDLDGLDLSRASDVERDDTLLAATALEGGLKHLRVAHSQPQGFNRHDMDLR